LLARGCPIRCFKDQSVLRPVLPVQLLGQRQGSREGVHDEATFRWKLGHQTVSQLAVQAAVQIAGREIVDARADCRLLGHANDYRILRPPWRVIVGILDDDLDGDRDALRIPDRGRVQRPDLQVVLAHVLAIEGMGDHQLARAAIDVESWKLANRRQRVQREGHATCRTRSRYRSYRVSDTCILAHLNALNATLTFGCLL